MASMVTSSLGHITTVRQAYMVLFLQFPNPPLLPSLAPVPSDCSDGSGGGKSEQHEALDDALMKRMRNYWLVLAVLFAIALWVGPVAATTFTALDLPGYAHGISGNNIVGYYSDQTGVHGYLYDGSTLTTLDDPSGTRTFAYGVSGGDVVGYSWNSSSDTTSAFLYNGSTYTALTDPSAPSGVIPYGISGGNIVGVYNNGTPHGFLYNGSTWTTIDDPLGSTTNPFGVSGSNVVGVYWDSSFTPYGFLYNGSTYTTLSGPLGAVVTLPYGIDGDNIVGYYGDSSGIYHGFLYNGSTYTTIDDPSETFGGPRNGTWLWGISGSNILGSYWDSSGGLHYFEATVPEPSTFALLGAAAVALIGFRWRKKRA